MWLSHSVVSDSLWLHGLQPARLLCPWNFPGKNAGVGCHFLLQGNFLTQGLNLCLLLWQADCVPLCHLKSPVYYMKSESESHSVVSDSLRPHGLFSPWNSLGQNTGVSSLSLLQVIFPTQGSNLGLPHCRRIIYQLSHTRNRGESTVHLSASTPHSHSFSLARFFSLLLSLDYCYFFLSPSLVGRCRLSLKGMCASCKDLWGGGMISLPASWSQLGSKCVISLL